MIEFPEPDKIGSATPRLNEFVPVLVYVIRPCVVIFVFGVTGTVTVLTAVPWVTVMELPVPESTGFGTVTTKELVTGLVMFAIPPGVKVVLGVEAIVAVLTAVP